MKPEYEPRTRDQFYGYLIEECGEVLAAAGKTMRWGELSVNPELPPEKQVANIDWLRAEMKDLEGAIARMRRFLDAAEEADELDNAYNFELRDNGGENG